MEKKSHFLLNFLTFLIIILVGIVFYARYLGTKGLITKEYRVSSDLITSNFSGVKIVQFSDLLYKSTVDKNDVKTLVDKINLLKPDLIVFTGDLMSVNLKNDEEDINYLKEELTRLNASIGKYAIYGDYDYSYEDYESLMIESGFIVLNNSYDKVYYKTDEYIYLVGLPSIQKEEVKLTDAFSFYDDINRRYTVVLAHDGKSIKELMESEIEVDLVLLGHSLGGSVVIPFYGSLFVDDASYKYYQEYYKKGITNIYVSSGIGTNKYPYRFLNKPSFNLYRLKAQS